MKYRLRIYPAADADVDDAAMFIAQDNISAALRFYDAVGKTFQQIREHPTRWPRFELDHPRLTTLRKCSVAGFRKYLVFYLRQGDSIDVLRVLHGARDIPSILLEGRSGVDPD